MPQDRACSPWSDSSWVASPKRAGVVDCLSAFMRPVGADVAQLRTDLAELHGPPAAYEFASF